MRGGTALTPLDSIRPAPSSAADWIFLKCDDKGDTKTDKVVGGGGRVV